MARRHPVLRGLAIMAGLVLGLVVLVVGVAALSGSEAVSRLTLGKHVAVVEIRGVIQDATETVDALERHRKSDGTIAVVVRIDSPGGAVAPSQEMYDAVWRLREKKPVIASLGNVAASGGYYVASAANVIVADPGTLTGSIGAIMEIQNLAALAEKIGVGETVVKSGRFKDVGHPLRPMTEDERRLLQVMVDDVLDQFVAAVARGRGLNEERVRSLADGRLYSGSQARSVGLVDDLGGLDAATRIAWSRAGQSGEPQVSHPRTRTRPWWLDLLGLAHLPELGVPGGLLFLYRGALPS
jgi:protease-4